MCRSEDRRQGVADARARAGVLEFHRRGILVQVDHFPLLRRQYPRVPLHRIRVRGVTARAPLRHENRQGEVAELEVRSRQETDAGPGIPVV